MGRREGVKAAWRRRFLPALLAILWIAGAGGTARASLVQGTYEFDWDRDVDKKEDGTTQTDKIKQTLELKYKGLLSTAGTSEFTFKVEQEINTDAPEILRFLPTLDLQMKGVPIQLTAGAKRTEEISNEPNKNPKITDSYYVETFFTPVTNIPDFKGKVTVDTDFEAGASNSVKEGITLSSVYRPNEWLDIKGDYTWNGNDDKFNPDSDTIDQKGTASVALRRMFTEKVKFDGQYTVEETTGRKVLDSGASENRKDDQSHSVKTSLAYRPFATTNLSASWDADIKLNLETDEHNHTLNRKASLDQNLLGGFDISADFAQNITEAKHTSNDNRKTEDTWTVEAKKKFVQGHDFSVKWEDKVTDEEFFVTPLTNKLTDQVTWTGTWTGTLTAFWRGQASYEWKDTTITGVLNEKNLDKKTSLKSTFDFKNINLILDPSYDITVAEKIVESTKTRDFKFKIAYRFFPSYNTEARFDHTYGRKIDSGTAKVTQIERADNSTANVTWKDPIPGWIFGFDLTRAATDKSEDANPPDINTTFGFKADYKWTLLAINISYKYDKKTLSADGETLDAKVGWTTSDWEASVTYNFTKVFSDQIDEKYSISLTFKYNL